MSDEIKINRPPMPIVKPEHSASPMTDVKDRMSNDKSSKMPWIVLAVIVIILVIGGILFRGKLFGSDVSTSAMTAKSTSYQAIFLTNGQVYFGKISDTDANYVVMKDIYYLQVVQPPLQGTPTAGQAATGTQQPQISLVKLGNELHGPVDEMHISRTQILFYEDLKNEGNVVKAIQAYKANPSGAAPLK